MILLPICNYSIIMIRTFSYISMYIHNLVMLFFFNRFRTIFDGDVFSQIKIRIYWRVLESYLFDFSKKRRCPAPGKIREMVPVY